MSQTVQVLMIMGIVLFALSASVCLWCSVYLFRNLHQRLMRVEAILEALAETHRQH